MFKPFFNRIKVKNNKNWSIPINKEEFKELHKVAIKKLKENIEKENLIVITHFSPVRKIGKHTTSHPEYIGGSHETYFANQLEKDLYKNVKIWMSGHTHYCYDFLDEKTRFISNAVGYPNEDVKWDKNIVYEIKLINNLF